MATPKSKAKSKSDQPAAPKKSARPRVVNSSGGEAARASSQATEHAPGSLGELVEATRKATQSKLSTAKGTKGTKGTNGTKGAKAAKSSVAQGAAMPAASGSPAHQPDALDTYQALSPSSTPAPTPRVEGALEGKLARQPPRALNSPIRVFQMHTESWQRELLDSAFYALDVSRVDPHALDVSVWTQLQANPATQGAQLWGAVSWRFAERTGMSGADWVRQIDAQPGSDVYFSCADVQHESVFHNPWLQAETQFPRFLEIARAFFEANALSPEHLSAITPSAITATGGMLVASPAFWSAYLPWLRKLLVTADKRMPAALRDAMHAPIAGADQAGHQGYLPFIIERLLAVFLRTEGKNFTFTRIALPERERELNVHQKLLREMKDVAHRTQSAWLAACWVNYRNLFLGQTQSKPWIQQYLRAITPTEIKFG